MNVWNFPIQCGEAEFKLLRIFRERTNYNILYTLPFNTLLLILDGGSGASSFTNIETGQSIVPATGDIILIPAMMPVWSRPHNDMLYIAIHFNLEYLPGCEVFDRNTPMTAESNPAGVIDINHSLEHEPRLKTLFQVQAFALDYVLRHWPAGFENRIRRTSPFEPVLNYVREKICAGMSVDELADFFGESRESFSRKFHREIGIPPKAFLDQELFRKAQLLLSDANLKINTVARQTGFSSASYFSVFFKRISGISPGEYRTEIIKSKF